MTKISKEKLEQFLKMVDEAENIGIASHLNPDGDNIGSTLALARSIRAYGKEVDVLGHDEIDDYLKFLPDLEYYTKDYKDAYDLFIILDASEFDRIGDATPVGHNSNKTIVIDHHVGGAIDCDLNIIVDDSPATCELIFEVIDNLDLPMDKTIATLLYTGIVTDTGRFLYSNVAEYTFTVAGKLISLGADTEFIYVNLYQSKPIERMKFENEIISKAEFFDNKVLAIASKEDVEKYGVQMGDSESVVNMLRDLKGIDVSMLIKEYGVNEYKVSLRSKEVDVAKVARANGGGGHIMASGFTIEEETLDKAYQKGLEILKGINA